jgi:hypothetical protein
MAVQRSSTPASRGAKPVAGKGSTAVAKKGELIPATFLAVESQDMADYDLPDGMDGATIAPSSLTPTVQWEQVGNYVVGTFLGMQEKVGPNASRLYNLRTDDGEVVSVWGTTVLDNRMDLLRVPVGARLTIIFVGESEAKKGQNPAKIFKVAYKDQG